MADNDDMDLNDDTGSEALSSSGKSKGLGGMLPGMLKWIAFGVGALILIIVSVFVCFKLFGKNSNQYLKDTIGDYLIVAKRNISLNYDDTSPIFKANHAGLTRDELDIPLIVIDCNKNY